MARIHRPPLRLWLLTILLALGTVYILTRLPATPIPDFAQPTKLVPTSFAVEWAITASGHDGLSNTERALGGGAPPRPRHWVVRMVPGPAGATVGVVDDPAVPRAVLQDYLAAQRWLYESGPVDPARVGEYFADDLLRTGVLAATAIRNSLESLAEQNQYFQLSLAGGRRRILVSNFSPDGKSVHVMDLQDCRRNLQYLDRSTKEVLAEKQLPSGIVVALMVYDEEVDRWKIARLEFATLDHRHAQEVLP